MPLASGVWHPKPNDESLKLGEKEAVGRVSGVATRWSSAGGPSLP
jgi:hypothetical protein